MVAITWLVLHDVWNVGNFEGFTEDFQSAQRFEGILAIAIRIALLVVFLQIKRKYT